MCRESRVVRRKQAGLGMGEDGGALTGLGRLGRVPQRDLQEEMV